MKVSPKNSFGKSLEYSKASKHYIFILFLKIKCHREHTKKLSGEKSTKDHSTYIFATNFV